MDKYNEAINLLKKYNQYQVLKQLENYKDIDLIEQVLNIDFEELKNLKQQIKKQEVKKETDIIENIKYTNIDNLSEKEKNEYEKIGNSIIESGKYAVVTMAGGQGTRLGHNGPKGTYLLNTKKGPKYIFEILADTLKRANKKYSVVIPWYIMISEENKDDTINFFNENNYFNYPKEKMHFFKQGEMPLLNDEEQLLIDENGKIKYAANGNGSIYYSMKKHGILENMKQDGIEWVYICSVDNILLKMVEPLLLGVTIKNNNQIGSKTIEKINPEEKVGVFCRKNGKPYVIEYTEMPTDMLYQKDEKGNFLYNQAHILCNLFSVNALEKIASEKLPYHIAYKKINHYIDSKEIIPDKENAYKFEQFIFDSFSLFDDITLINGKRDEDFAPVKNKEGNDSPKTAIELYNNYWMK